jgi:hypothetical protein
MLNEDFTVLDLQYLEMWPNSPQLKHFIGFDTELEAAPLERD